MKTTTIISSMLAALLFAGGCAQKGGAGEGEQAGQGGQQGPGGPADATRAEPGAQESQAGMLTQGAQTGSALALAQPGASARQTQGTPDLQAGQQLASSGNPSGVAACAGCHGAQGEGNPAGGFPRIAGQSAYYLGKQLAAYANGARVNPIMVPIAKAMSAAQIRDVSAYYAQLGQAGAAGPQAAPVARGKPGAAERGRLLAMVGDNAREIQACANCHGPGGAGEPPITPYLAGQHAGYLSAAMASWRSGERKTDQSGQMTHVGRALSDADVAALSAYFSAQPAPPPAGKWLNVPAGSSERPAVAAAAGAPGPVGGSKGTAGAGTESGTPTTGGAQGPGGGGGAQGTQPPQPPVRR
jgi:cytochrome c553